MNMKRVQIYSTALSVGCALGILMAVILTGNQNTLPRTAVVIPTKNPFTLQANRQINLPGRLPFQRSDDTQPQEIDRIITSSIARKDTNARQRGIGDLISAQELNPFPGGAKTVTVMAGDTLFGIAKRTGINAHKLAALNGIDAPFIIRPGQILHLKRAE